jgi:hypothetical protein
MAIAHMHAAKASLAPAGYYLASGTKPTAQHVCHPPTPSGRAVAVAVDRLRIARNELSMRSGRRPSSGSQCSQQADSLASFGPILLCCYLIYRLVIWPRTVISPVPALRCLRSSYLWRSSPNGPISAHTGFGAADP